MPTETSLRTLKKNQRFIVTKVDSAGEMGRRIRDMGLTPGTEARIVGRAPLRDPVALRLKDFTLTLRNNEADHVFVNILED